MKNGDNQNHLIFSEDFLQDLYLIGGGMAMALVFMSYFMRLFSSLQEDVMMLLRWNNFGLEVRPRILIFPKFNFSKREGSSNKIRDLCKVKLYTIGS